MERTHGSASELQDFRAGRAFFCGTQIGRGDGHVVVAVNDALLPFNTSITHQPFTPGRILDCLKRGVR
jgi:hypothetical protein